MTSSKKSHVLIFLSLFGIVMLGFTGLTIYEYVHFRGGESVEGTVVDVDRSGAGKNRRVYATIEAEVDGTTVSERVRVRRGGFSIGKARVSSSAMAEGDVIEMVVVPSGDGYDMAVAQDARNPWMDLFWEAFTLSLIGFLVLRITQQK